MEKVRAQVFISGLVQGVFYRDWTRRNAQELGLTGWVKNLPDGRVEAVFEASAGSAQEGKEKIEEMIERCRQGPPAAVVEKVEVKWKKIKGEFASFEILR